jgi:nitric oxide reductase subunit B
VVRERVALTVVLLDIILYSVGGVIGTMHHLYFSGAPAENMALGAFFSALEVMPLTFLTVEAWSFLQLGARQESKSRTPFPHRWAVMFLVAVGFWNFLGAGIFGFLINLPIVSYYEIGTALTANHGHTAMMGVYGMLAVGLALFCLRYLIPAERWKERAGQDELLRAQHRARLDGVRHALPARDPADLRVGQQQLLRGSLPRLPDHRHQYGDRVAAPAR